MAESNLSSEIPKNVEEEMGRLMLGMEGDAKKIGQYYHELTYNDPKTGENVRVFFLKSGGSDGGYVLKKEDGTETKLPPKDYGVYVSKRGLFLCASPTHDAMTSAINSGKEETIKRSLWIAMTDHSVPSNVQMSGAVENAFLRSRQPYLESIKSQQEVASKTISLAQNITTNIARV